MQLIQPTTPKKLNNSVLKNN